MADNLSSGLYLVCTPIGNRGDITLRTLEILKECDILISEDTRVAKKLLSMYSIPLRGRQLLSYKDKSTHLARKKIIEFIKANNSVVLMSDAGSPLISDPGHKLVSDVIFSGESLFSLPGASSVITALSLSGLPVDQFFYYGFLPTKKGKMKEELRKIKEYSCTSVFFESPKRLIATLKLFESIFGKDHAMTVCREMTKKFEEINRGSISELLNIFQSRKTIRGEIVIVVEPASPERINDLKLDQYLRFELKSKSVKDSVEFLSETLSISKKLLYDRALTIINQQEH